MRKYEEISFLKRYIFFCRVVKNQNENALEKGTRKWGIRKNLRNYLMMSASLLTHRWGNSATERDKYMFIDFFLLTFDYKNIFNIHKSKVNSIKLPCPIW